MQMHSHSRRGRELQDKQQVLKVEDKGMDFDL